MTVPVADQSRGLSRVNGITVLGRVDMRSEVNLTVGIETGKLMTVILTLCLGLREDSSGWGVTLIILQFNLIQTHCIGYPHSHISTQMIWITSFVTITK